MRLDYSDDKWLWSCGDVDPQEATEEDITWFIHERSAEEFVSDLGKFLSSQKMLAVTA